jgi:hypothetical protein
VELNDSFAEWPSLYEAAFVENEIGRRNEIREDRVRRIARAETVVIVVIADGESRKRRNRLCRRGMLGVAGLAGPSRDRERNITVERRNQRYDGEEEPENSARI